MNLGLPGGTAHGADPFRGFRFRVTIGLDDGGPPHGGFSEVSGLGMKTDAVAYREGSANDSAVRKLPAIGEVADITLKRGLMAGGDLYLWLEAAKNAGNEAAKTVRVDLMAEDGSGRVASWALINARPVEVSGPSLNATATEVAVEELVLAAEGVELA